MIKPRLKEFKLIINDQAIGDRTKICYLTLRPILFPPNCVTRINSNFHFTPVLLWNREESCVQFFDNKTMYEIGEL